MGERILEYRSVFLTYAGQQQPTLQDIDFHVLKGEFVTILGNSGSGKTTLIKLANRLLSPTEGSIYFEGNDIRNANVQEIRRNMGYVIQQVGLFPHMTIEQNISIMAKVIGWSREKIDSRVDELLNLVQLPATKDLKKRHPWQLSGGQQQRVGLARALCSDPMILLMDEPFGALDVITRKELQKEFAEIQKTYRKTVLFVTHDLQEAIDLGDRVMVLNEGKVQQFDTAKNLILHPAKEYVRTLFNAPTPVEKIRFFSVKDFPELIRAGKAKVEASVRWDDPMKSLLDQMLKGNWEISVYRNADFIGNISCDDLKNIGEIEYYD